MLTAEIKINGALIAVLYAHRETANWHLGKLVENTYTWEYWSPGEKGFAATGTVVHDYDEGAEGLVRKILDEVKSSK